MTYRMTVVLEYPSKGHAPRINARTKAKDLGDGEVVALQFSDALRELEALDGFATEQAKRAAALAAENYPQKGPTQETSVIPGWKCPKCLVDRTKEPCPETTLLDCPMVGTAQITPVVRAERKYCSEHGIDWHDKCNVCAEARV